MGRLLACGDVGAEPQSGIVRDPSRHRTHAGADTPTGPPMTAPITAPVAAPIAAPCACAAIGSASVVIKALADKIFKS